MTHIKMGYVTDPTWYNEWAQQLLSASLKVEPPFMEVWLRPWATWYTQ